MEQPLSGIKVVEIGGTIVAASATKQFTDFGAQVIKIDLLDGGEIRRTPPFYKDKPSLETGAFHIALDTGKKSIVIDHSSNSGKEIISRICQDAQLVVINLPVEETKKIIQIIDKESGPSTVAISPHGLEGPYSNRTENEMSIFAWTTRMERHGHDGSEPLRYGPHVANIQVGATAAAVGLSIVWGQDHDNIRRDVDLSCIEALAGNVDTGYVDWVLLGTQRKSGMGRNTDNYPIGIYECKDGYVMFAATLGPQFSRLCEAIGHPELVDDPRFNDPIEKSKNFEAFMKYLDPWLSIRTKKEVFKEMQEFRVMVAPVVNMSEVVEDEQAVARNSFVEIEHNQIGKTTIHGAPFKMNDSWKALPPPEFGMHTTEILAKLNYSKDEQIALFKIGAIR
jgi:crotonobetainyl-CoA:carnitine CoA-transferase CaiB-like acyl-CoA transferase